MGTRADFYIGRGESSEWVGSIAWDGYIEGIWQPLLESSSDDEFTANVSTFFASRDDVTTPEQGWPWPWNTSHTTDYSYAFDNGQVWVSCFGCPWFTPDKEPEDLEEVEGDAPIFPDMSGKKNALAQGNRSGLIVFRQ